MNWFRMPAPAWCLLWMSNLGLAFVSGHAVVVSSPLLKTTSANFLQSDFSSVQSSSAQSSSVQSSTAPIDLSTLRTKAEAGDAAAQYQLGKAYENGSGIAKDDGQAVAWFKKAAEQGNAAAANSLGVMYSLGNGVEKSKEQAVVWYRKAARLGNAQAMFNLGASYYNGDGVVENQMQAFDWFLLAQDGGDAAATDAVRRSAADLGQSSMADAILEIGEMYERGEALPKSFADAARWYRKGASENAKVAMSLAALLIDGTGVNKDYVEAMNLCRDAAKKNYGPAEFCVGYLYRQGFGVPVDAKETAKWYDRAANHGHGPAQLALAEMYAKGDGVGVDRPEAYRLLFLAYRNRVLQDPAHKESILQAKSQARALREEMSKDELKKLDKKFHAMNLDPKAVYKLVDDPAPADSSRQVFLPVVR